MRNQKTHEKNNIKFEFKPKFSKWEFTLPTGSTFITPATGGLIVATKIASVLSGSVKRCGAVDGLARANIATLNGE